MELDRTGAYQYHDATFSFTIFVRTYVYLSIYLSIYLSTYLSMHLYIYYLISVYLYMCVCLIIYLFKDMHVAGAGKKRQDVAGIFMYFHNT